MGDLGGEIPAPLVKIRIDTRSAIANPGAGRETLHESPRQCPGTFSGFGPLSMSMRRTPWFRALATSLAVWFPLIVGEPGVLHLCPMHGGVPAATSPQSMAHAHHAAMSSTERPTDHGRPPGHDHHHCSCIGSCTSSAAALPAPGDSVITIVGVNFTTRAALPNAESLARPAPEYSRPYTTGPPRA